MIDLMDERVVKAILETMPAEITVIDAKDEVIGWNKDETRIFKRAASSLQLNFRRCHPKESLWKVEQIVKEMSSRKRDKARFWIDLPRAMAGPSARCSSSSSRCATGTGPTSAASNIPATSRTSAIWRASDACWINIEKSATEQRPNWSRALESQRADDEWNCKRET